MIEPIIGTHSGNFHCDEILACVILKTLPQYTSAKIIRSREPKDLEPCDIVVDVGGVYDHNSKRYDHHQATFKKSAKDLDCGISSCIKLSSAGLVYLHYGKKSIAQIFEMDENSDVVENIFKKFYFNLIQEVDAIDNGIDIASDCAYRISTDLASRVARFNSAWNVENIDENEQFFKAYDMVKEEYLSMLLGYKNQWVPALKIVQSAIKAKDQTHKSGKAIELETPCPWKEHLLDIEESQNSKIIAFVIYKRKDGSWSLQGVPKNRTSFECVMNPPSSWFGHRNEELSAITGIDNCVFCHATGFLMINKTRDGIYKMLEKCLELESSN